MAKVQEGLASAHRKAQLGVVFMVFAMLLIPVVDATAKWLSTTHSPWLLGWVRYTVASVFVLPIAARVHGRAIFPKRGVIIHGLRTACLVIAMTFYFLAIARVPLSTAVTAYFVGPILAVGLAILLLGEQLTTTKVASLTLGFLGTIVVLQPGVQVDGGMLLALGAGLFFALYLVATRNASRCDPPLATLAFQCVFGAMLLTPQALLNWSTPDLAALGLFIIMGLFSALSHLLTISAFSRADASTLAPLVYVEMISAIGLGWLIFGEIPTATVLIGGGMIALAGLLLIRRQPT